jgi:hypothetical protein
MATQRRRVGEFASAYSDTQLYLLIRKLAQKASDNEPVGLSQPVFDRNAPAVANLMGLSAPATARAIYMRFKKKRKGTSWREIVEAAVGALNVTQQVAADNSAEEVGEWLDERGIVFALRRVVGAAGRPTLTDYQYDAKRRELLGNAFVALVLPTSAQIATVAGDWKTALALAGMDPPKTDLRATPIVRLAWHFYEMNGKLPTDTTLRAYCNQDLGVAMPRARDKSWQRHLDDLRAARSDRGWSTPQDGPLDGERLSEGELAELLVGARPAIKRGGWTENAVLAAFVEFTEMFHGRETLSLRLYRAHAPGHGWPSSHGYDRYGGFTAMKERAVKIVVERLRQAA